VTDAILDRAAVAERLGIHRDSVTRLINRGQCPEPDGRAGQAPWWYEATITAWIASRPGRGAGGGRPRKTPAA
jgi:predicted DNA-binding transcriptional regulator AlpA